MVGIVLSTLVWPAEAFGQSRAFTILGGELLTVDVSRAELRSLGPLDIGRRWASAMAADGAGGLFAVLLDASEPQRETSVWTLFRVDPATLAAERIGSLGLPEDCHPTSLTTDPSGHLWLASDSGLFQVDTATGRARRHGAALPARQSLDAVAARGDDLFGILSSDTPRGQALVSIDTQSGDLRLLADGLGLGQVEDLDFDVAGQAWLLTSTRPPETPPTVVHSLYRAEELASGRFEEVSQVRLADRWIHMTALALPAVEIPGVPALGRSGLAVLLTLFVLSAVCALRRYAH